MYFKAQFIKLTYITLFIALVVSCTNQQPKSNDKTAEKPLVSESIPTSALEISNQIEADPENPELFYQRAVIYFNEKYLAKALSDIDDAIKLNGQNPLYHFYRGKVLYAMNRTLDASKSYEAAIALKPDYTEAMMKLAELYFIVKEHTKSINLLNKLIVINPTNGNAQFFKGMNQKETGDTAKAVASFQKALELDADDYDAAMQLGLLFTIRKNPLALEYFNTAIRLRPKSDEAYFAKAYYYQQVRKFQDALLQYRKVISINPSNDKAYFNVGVINYDVKQYKEALRSWDICIQMNNQYIEAYYMRGLVYEELKNKAEAKLNYQYALQLAPNYTLAQEGLKRVK